MGPLDGVLTHKLMKKLTLSIIMSFAAIVAMAQGMNIEPDGTTLEQASELAKAQNKLIFLDCYTQWCGPCKKMAKQVFPLEEVGAYMNPKFINLKIDMETEYGSALAKKLQVTAYPTFVIFNADAKEIGRFVGGSIAPDFLAKVEKNSNDNTASDLEARWKNGDRDQEFLLSYLKTLTASYKADDANDVAEAILDGSKTSFVEDAKLRDIFIRNITNPFAKSFVTVAKNPSVLTEKIGDAIVEAKIYNVLNNYNSKLIIEEEGKVSLDEENFNKFKALLSDIKAPNANHFILSTQINLAAKQKDYDSYIKYIKQYMKDKSIDANDMQLANWVKPFSDPSVKQEHKDAMKKILNNRISEIRSGKREAMNKIGNMKLSIPTDQLLEKLVGVLEGKMPQ